MAFAIWQQWRYAHVLRGVVPSTFRYWSIQSYQIRHFSWQVSSLGRCRSTYGIITEGSLHTCGYRRVTIEGRMWLIHRIVKLAFHGPPKCDGKWQVNHVDGNPGNNRLNNLEYVTPSQNILHSYATRSRCNTWQIQSKPILWRAAGSIEWSRCPSITVAARQFGISSRSISKSCRQGSPVKGYEFAFQDVQEDTVDGEQWRPMIDPNSGHPVPGRLVSSLGRITSRYGHVSRGYQDKSGYFFTQVCGQIMRVHRLVAFAFLEPQFAPRENQVNHKDLNKGNNAVENLEYVTPAENRAHFLSNDTIIRVSGCRPVWGRRHGSCETWVWYPSMAAAAKALGLNHGSISQCINGKYQQSGGYEFKPADSQVTRSLPGEVWRDVNVHELLKDRELRTKRWCARWKKRCHFRPNANPSQPATQKARQMIWNMETKYPKSKFLPKGHSCHRPRTRGRELVFCSNPLTFNSKVP